VRRRAGRGVGNGGAGRRRRAAERAGRRGRRDRGWLAGVLYVRRTSYYYFGGQRVAMRQTGSWGGDVVYYLVSDHLGTTSLVLNGAGHRIAETRHYPYGAERWVWTADGSGTLPTDYRFTGQRNVGLGLTHMGARFLDSSLGRWTSADTIVPDFTDPQSFNRYSYVRGRPLRFVDPTGHFESEEELAKYLGFSSLESWWNSELYAAWSQDQEWMEMILSKEFDFGNMLRFESNGTVYETMLVMTEQERLTLWDINLHGSHRLQEVFESTGYTHWHSDGKSSPGFSLAHSGRNTKNLLHSPSLRDDWNGYPGSTTRDHVRIQSRMDWGRMALDVGMIVGGVLGVVGEGLGALLSPEPASKLVFAGALTVTVIGIKDTISQVRSGGWVEERRPVVHTTPCCW
jgi:RHS repeat-associated protein